MGIAVALPSVVLFVTVDPERDTPETLASWAKEANYPFIFLSDPDGAVGKAYGGTINDAVLGMCSGAMRKYLQSLNELPDKPLKAMARESLADQVLAHDTNLLNKSQRRQVLSAALLDSGQELIK